MTEIRNRSLEQLEAGIAVGEGESYLISETRRLVRVPLRQLRLEDLRLLIGQNIGLQYLVPMAIDHVETHPLAHGDFYPGDLLKQVMEVDESFWVKRTDLRVRLVAALERALERVRKTRTPTELERELRVGLTRHQTALRTT